MTTIKINENNGYILTSVHGNGYISFFGSIPDEAVVKSVRVNNEYLEDYIDCNIAYPRTIKDGEIRLIAVLKNADKTELFTKVESGLIKNFEVECI